MYVATTRHLNCSGQEFQKMQFIFRTLKQSKGRQIVYESVDPKQDHNHAKLGKPCLNTAQQKANVKFFVKSENISVISLEHMRKSQRVVYSLIWLGYLRIIRNLESIGKEYKLFR